MGQVPALYVEGVTLTQSLPIIEYLEETHPGKNLLPKDPILRAQVRISFMTKPIFTSFWQIFSRRSIESYS